MKIKEYAKQHNISYATARNRLRMLGISCTNYQKLSDIYSNRKTIMEMAKEANVSEQVVRSFLTKFNFGYKKEYRKTIETPEKIKSIIMSYRQGETVANISKQFGVSRQYVYHVFKKKKILLK